MFIHSDEPQYDAAGRLHTFCHAVHGKWHMMGVTLSAAGSLNGFMENVCPELAAKRGGDPYQVLNTEAAAVSAGSEGCCSCHTWLVNARLMQIPWRAAPLSV